MKGDMLRTTMSRSTYNRCVHHQFPLNYGLPDAAAKSFLFTSWKKEVRNENVLSLFSETEEQIIIFGDINLIILLGDICSKAIINMVEKVLLNILLGTHLIEKYDKNISSTERKLTLLDLRPTAVISTGTLGKLAISAICYQKTKIRTTVLTIVGVNWTMPSCWEFEKEL